MTIETSGAYESPTELPPEVELTRTTPVFTETTVPAGLLAAHQVASGVWGRLIVHTGELRFTFEDAPDQTHMVGAGETQVIPPQRPHHLTVAAPTTFAVEFYKAPPND